MPELGELLSVDYWREHRIGLLYGIAGLLLFVISIIGTFPYDQALSSALLPMGLRLSYSSERPAFPVGAVMENVTLVRLDQPSPPLVQSEALKLTPGIDTLIGRPAIGIRSDMYGGRVWVKIRRHGDVTGVKLDLNSVDVSRYPAFGFPLKGIVSGKADLQAAGASIASRKGAFTLEGRNVELELVKGVPPFRFASLKGQCTIDGQTLHVDALQGSGPDMAISGSGLFHLGPTLSQTMMEMTLRISPTLAGRARLGLLFGFLPHPPDNRPYIFHGPVLMPQVS